MSSDTTLLIKGTIAELPELERQRVGACYSKLVAMIQESGAAGVLALALVAAELEDAG